MSYPKDFESNLKFRARIIQDAEKDPLVIATTREIVKRDILFFFNVFCWAYDPMSEHRRPSLRDKNRPIITYDYQDEAIQKINLCIESGENLFIDKSRDMLATYMVLYTYLWRWLTKDSEEFRLGSRKEDSVDKTGDMDSLFEKMRYNLKHIPWWLLPQGFDISKHSPYMKLINPERNCAIIGEATNKDFARGGRKVSVLFDEFQAWEMAEDAWKSATDSTRCKIALGTPQGAGNKFAELARTEEVKNKLHLIWYLHPEKAYTTPEYLATRQLQSDQSTAPAGCYIDINGKIRSQWYDNEVSRRDPKDVAENLDCDYLTSGLPYFDTNKCEIYRREMSQEGERGNLLWLVAPFYDSNGNCSNKEQLRVEFVPNINGRLKIWEHPKKDYDNGYCIGADVAEGLEQGDYSSASVLKRFILHDDGKPETVAAFHGHIPIYEYAEELAKLGFYYGEAYIAPERNKDGSAVILQLMRIYRRIWHKDVITKGYPEMTDRMGFDTANQHVKHSVCGELQKAISFGLLVDHDEEFWKETLTFINNDGKLEAQGKSQGQKCFDDRVMDRAIGWWVNSRLPYPTRLVKIEDAPHWERHEPQTQTRLVGWVV